MRTNDRAAWAHAAARALSRSGRRMLSLTLSLVLALTLLPGMALAAGDVEINVKNFPDANFQKYIKDVLDTNKDGSLSEAEIAKVTELTFEYPDSPGVKMSNIASLKGIEYFTALTTLDCSEQKLTTLDVSANTNLTTLNCSENRLTSLDLSENTALTELNCRYNKLTSLDLSKNTALTTLNCSYNKLAALDVSNNTDLNDLICSENQLERLNVSANTALTRLTCNDNKLIALVLGQNTALTTLACDSNQLTSLDVRGNTNLTKLYCGSNQLRTLDLSQNKQLTSLLCAKNQLTSLDLSSTKVTQESCNTNGNQYTLNLKDGDNTFELSELTKFGFDVKKASNWRYGAVNGTTLTVNEGAETVLYNYSCGKDLTADFQLKVHADPVRAIKLAGIGSDTVRFDDLNVGYSTVTVKDFIIRNTGNMSTGELKVMLEGTNGTAANAFQLSCENGTVVDDGILLPSIQVGGTVPTVKYQPADKLPAGTYTATVTVKSADDDGKAISESFNIFIKVLPEPDPVTHTVSFNANGGTGEMADVTVTGASAAYTLPACGFTAPQGMRFKGWATSANGAVLTGTTITVTGDITLYAIWEKTSVTPVTPTTPTQPAAPKLPFTDVSEDDWFYADAAYLYEKGVMKGTADETFAPGRSVTRGQLAAALYRMAGEPAVTAKAAFTDVPADYWCAAAITWAAENGVVTGYGDGGFRPADAVQRQELAAMLFRFAVYQGMSAVTLEENLAPFADRADVAAYAVPAMNWAVGQGILQGKDGGLLPQAPVDRAQLAAMLRRYLEK